MLKYPNSVKYVGDVLYWLEEQNFQQYCYCILRETQLHTIFLKLEPREDFFLNVDFTKFRKNYNLYYFGGSFFLFIDKGWI